MMRPSKIRYMAGMSRMTDAILTRAPLASNVQIDPIMSTLEYTETPKVATKKLQPLVMIDRIQVLCAIETDSCLLLPAMRSDRYRLVIRIA